MRDITVFRARKFITMDPVRPAATHVAVRDGRILAVGGDEIWQGLGAARADDRYADAVLMPGLVEAHSHLMEGALWKFVYAGYYDRRDPEGRLWTGLKSVDGIVERLAEMERTLADPDAPLLAWGFDPVYFGEQRMTARELDAVSERRPIVLLHASFHLMNVNSAMLRKAGITRQTDIEGIARHADGEPNGELQGFAAMFPVNRAIGNVMRTVGVTEEGVWRFARVAQRTGVTTATDLVNNLAEPGVRLLEDVTSREDYPLRIVPIYRGPQALATIEQDLGLAALAAARSTDKLRFGAMKLTLDGSITGYTARLRWPGYHNGKPNGIWIMSPTEVHGVVARIHGAGVQLHIHTNGDEATGLALDAIEAALEKHPRPDHRHTLHHCQTADAAQFRRMARLGVCANLFVNHIYYWGDVHYAQTLGPSRANRMNACGTARLHGVPLAIHSDAPVTPIGPLFTAWCAAVRRTAGGRVLGEGERITVADALHAVTLGAAYTLAMDGEIGSIEVGKRADFCVLADDPLAVPVEDLKDVPVLGTMLGGRAFDAAQ
ncbi:amidohydrolase [Pigmentiphaga sp.]|uniref:amidohydrolase n=1 Tax=Pigmentiphaga sp. TaxID=1977564 RepID=UPI0025D3ADB5|nr:amidohydrolase [Pigmentiphaga sp.]